MSNNIIRCPGRERYTRIDNRVIEDPRLTWQALGIFTYIMSKPGWWKVNVSHLAKLRNLRRDGIYAALKNLIDYGYVHRETERSEKGRIIGTNWYFFESAQENPYCNASPYTAEPYTAEPYTAEPYTAEPYTAEPTLVNTDDLVITENLTKTEDIERERAREIAPAPAPESQPPLGQQERGQQESQSSLTSHRPVDPSLPIQSTKSDKPKKSKATRWPDADTPVPADWKAWATVERPDLDIEMVAACFVDHWVAKPGSGALKLDWKATWRNWVRGEKRQGGPGRGPGLSRQGQLEARNSAALDNWLRTRFGENATNGAIEGEVDSDA